MFTNAPKSVSLRTVPLILVPTLIASYFSFLRRSLSSTRTARCEATMRLRVLSTSIIFTRMGCFTKLSASTESFLRPRSDAGTNALTPLISQISPPLTASLPTASKIFVSSSGSSMRFSQTFLLSTFLLERRTLPSPSFTLSTSTSTVSPTLRTSSGRTLSSWENSLRGINPSDL